VVLLNDDIVVTSGWLSKLRAASKGTALTGAHTGKHCSGNPDMWGEGPTQITKYPINMFCAYIPRRIVQVVGSLDEEFVYYGGEDVDYSARSLLHGFPLIISDAYVNHKDNQSFGETKASLIKESDKIIYEKYQIGPPFDLNSIQPKVSAIMATRNRPDLLRTAINSIMNTDYGNFELIIVDDSSEPQTNALLIEEQNKYPNLLFIRLPRNLGSTKARKIGLDASKGQFVFFHDDDDTVLQNRIFKPLDHLILHPYLDVVYCNYNVVDNDLNITPVYCQPFNEKAYLNLEFNIGAGILLGRRSTFVEVPFYSLYDNAVDYDWVFRLIRAGYKIDLCPEIVMNYNRSGATSQHLSGNVASIGKHKEIYEREVLLQKIKRS
jgi:GT2 family glycosyltransferase